MRLITALFMNKQQNESKLKVGKIRNYDKTNRTCNENTVGNLAKPIEAIIPELQNQSATKWPFQKSALFPKRIVANRLPPLCIRRGGREKKSLRNKRVRVN
jgi:hypothetical protein